MDRLNYIWIFPALLFALIAYSFVYTIWWEFPRIQAACASIGAKPVSGRGDTMCKKLDGSLWAVPRI